MLHIPATGDGNPVKITLGAEATVQHDSAVPACRKQIISESLRCSGGAGAILAAVKGKAVALDADGTTATLTALSGVVNQLVLLLAAYNQRGAGDIVLGRGGEGHHCDVRPLVPAVAFHRVIRLCHHLAVHL